MDSQLQIREIKKQYDGQEVLHGISLDIKKGEVVVILGSSGCGKSTLLRCINGLEPISAGEILLDGKQIQYKSKDLVQMRQKIGMVFQSYDLFPHKTILDNITIAPVKVQNGIKKR